jgi:hypothetical protein
MNKLQTTAFVSIILLIIAFPLNAAVPTTPFQILGHIQNFCLDNQFNPATNTCPKDADPRSPIPAFNAADLANTLFVGAKIVVNGMTVTIPRNTVVVMPATYLTPWQIFFKAQGVSKVNNESGLALQDKVPPLAAFEVAVDGNIVCVTATTCDYVAGLVHISQQGLNMGAGFIRSINTTTGEMCIGNDNTPVATCVTPNARVQLNDPKINDTTDPALNDGRYGRPNPASPAAAPDPNSRFPDPRFTVDQGNPTVHALTGYPMCVPRSGNDPRCPAGNRPAGLKTFVMGPSPLPAPLPPGLGPIPNCVKAPGSCVQTEQAPFVVGDYINFQGTLANDATGLYISAHTVVANVGIYTQPLTDPTYVTQEVSLIGTLGPLGTPGCTTTMECQDRLKVEGFTTDPMISSPTSRPPNATARQINIYALDVDLSVDPTGSAPSVRRIARAADFRAVPLGRFRYILGKGAGVSVDSTGVQRGVTRELMVRVDTPAAVPPRNAIMPKIDLPKVANGLVPGQFTAPIGEYIFPEGLGLGDPQPKLNFQCLAFLTAGWALGVEDPTNTASQLMITPGQLVPWPDLIVPKPTFDPAGTLPSAGTGVNCRN